MRRRRLLDTLVWVILFAPFPALWCECLSMSHYDLSVLIYGSATVILLLIWAGLFLRDSADGIGRYLSFNALGAAVTVGVVLVFGANAWITGGNNIAPMTSAWLRHISILAGAVPVLLLLFYLRRRM